jgi:hypothetical protein
MKFQSAWLWPFLMTLVAPFFALGGWVSAGNGELFSDAHNPWFLKNVTQVNYCIDVASSSVSARPDEIRELVKLSLTFWQNEFTKVNQGMGSSQFILGNQKFQERPCSESDIDLRFQFGYETLTSYQISFLGDPTKYIGITVRTNDDYIVNLRGKGFIYIASDIGEKSYHGGKDATLISMAWKRKKLLQYVILHELGHVFGVPHTGSGLMAETFLEQMLSVSLADAFEQTPIESFFMIDEELDLCDQMFRSNFAMQWLGVPEGHNCLHLSHKKMNGQWELTSRKDNDSSTVKRLGAFIVGTPELLDLRVRPAIVLQLMGNLTVFTPQETKFRSFMFGPMLTEAGFKANFVIAPGNSKPAYLRFSPGSLLVQTVNGLKIENVISYSSPIGLLLLRDPTPLIHPSIIKKGISR